MPDATVRVAHIITRMILGGAQESTLALCDGLRKRAGWQTVLLTGPPSGPEGELLSEVRRLGVDCRLVNQLQRQINPIRDAVALWQLTANLRQLCPTIVHTHSSKAGILGRLAARIARVPFVVHTIRGLPFHPYAPAWQNSLFIAAERFAARLTDHFTAVARAMVDGAVSAGIAPPGRFTVVRSGIDVTAYRHARRQRGATRKRFGLMEHERVIGKIGRLFPLKGHRFLIAAAPRIIRQCPNARFLLLGDGILREQLQQQAESLGVGDRFIFAGLVPPDQIPACISAMDVLVHTSLREGLARVLVQALLCDTPVVTYSLDGAPEVVIDGVTGRLVPPESVDALAEAIVWMLNHPDTARAMAQEGKRRFAREFSVEAAISATERVYRQLLQCVSAPRP